MTEQTFKPLSYSQKIKLINDLLNYYKKSWPVYWEYWVKKWLVLELFLKAIELTKVTFKITRDLTDKELEEILKKTFDLEYCKSVISKTDKIWRHAFETWLWCLYAIVSNDAEVIDLEYEELQKRIYNKQKNWLTFNTWIFDYYKDTDEDPELIEPSDN